MIYVVTIHNLAFYDKPYVVEMPRLSNAFAMIRRYLDTPFTITLKRVAKS